MDLCLINIGDRQFSTPEIDVIHLLMEDESSRWTLEEIMDSLPYIADDVHRAVSRLVRSGLLDRTDDGLSESIYKITLRVSDSSRAWMREHQHDIDDAFIMINPDMFDVTEVAEA